jgi:hypothetical protein
VVSDFGNLVYWISWIVPGSKHLGAIIYISDGQGGTLKIAVSGIHLSVEQRGKITKAILSAETWEPQTVKGKPDVCWIYSLSFISYSS